MKYPTKLILKGERNWTDLTRASFSRQRISFWTFDHKRVAVIASGASSLRFSKVFLLKFEIERPGQLGESKEAEFMEINNQGEHNIGALVAVLAETGKAGGKHKDQLLLYSHQLLDSRNHQLVVPLGAKKVWILTLATSETGAGPDL